MLGLLSLMLINLDLFKESIFCVAFYKLENWLVSLLLRGSARKWSDLSFSFSSQINQISLENCKLSTKLRRSSAETRRGSLVIGKPSNC